MFSSLSFCCRICSCQNIYIIHVGINIYCIFSSFIASAVVFAAATPIRCERTQGQPKPENLHPTPRHAHHCERTQGQPTIHTVTNRKTYNDSHTYTHTHTHTYNDGLCKLLRLAHQARQNPAYIHTHTYTHTHTHTLGTPVSPKPSIHQHHSTHRDTLRVNTAGRGN